MERSVLNGAIGGQSAAAADARARLHTGSCKRTAVSLLGLSFSVDEAETAWHVGCPWMGLMRARCLVSLLATATAQPGCAVMDSLGELDAAAAVCARGPTLPGIDVSKWQGAIDWDQVAGAGIEFAFIRVNHGLDDIDERFQFNWAEARRVGITRGAYQYFLPNEDPVAQADLFLELMGPLQPGDLPPVLDVENTGGGMSPAAVAERVGQWMARVEPALGVVPILYTGKYFWQDNVGSSDFADHPLWIAYWNVECPDLPAPWTDWVFHQTSDNGSLPGIDGPVDTDLFNGSREDLAALGWNGACGDAVCSAGETPDTCAEDCPPQGEGEDDGGEDDGGEDESGGDDGALTGGSEGCAAGGADQPLRFGPLWLALGFAAFRARRRR